MFLPSAITEFKSIYGCNPFIYRIHFGFVSQPETMNTTRIQLESTAPEEEGTIYETLHREQ